MANFFTYDGTGALTAFAYNTSALSAPVATTTTSTNTTYTQSTPINTGSSSTGSQVAVIPFGSYWHSAYTSGTIGQLTIPVVNTNNNGLGQHATTYKASTATTINFAEMSEQGPCSGVHQLILRVNGVTPGTTINMGNGTAGATFTQPVTGVSLNAGDILTGYVAVGASGNTQCSVFLNITTASS